METDIEFYNLQATTGSTKTEKIIYKAFCLICMSIAIIKHAPKHSLIL